ncbi:MAG: MarR family transcriptional regulator, partial [Mesorhizobium sp.]
MTNDDSTARKTHPLTVRWADLADLILIVAREIQFRGYSDERAVQLSQ